MSKVTKNTTVSTDTDTVKAVVSTFSFAQLQEEINAMRVNQAVIMGSNSKAFSKAHNGRRKSALRIQLEAIELGEARIFPLYSAEAVRLEEMELEGTFSKLSTEAQTYLEAFRAPLQTGINMMCNIRSRITGIHHVYENEGKDLRLTTSKLLDDTGARVLAVTGVTVKEYEERKAAEE